MRWPIAGVAQSVERVLGKDEVSGSNPDTSSIREHPRPRAAGRSAAGESAGLGGQAEAIAACPNPTRFGATWRFRTRQEGPVKVSLYDVSGRCVRSYDEGTRIPGRYEIVWDGRDHNGQKVSAGVYFCRLEIGQRLSTARLVVLR